MEGWKPKSKLSRVLTKGKRAMAVRMATFFSVLESISWVSNPSRKSLYERLCFAASSRLVFRRLWIRCNLGCLRCSCRRSIWGMVFSPQNASRATVALKAAS